MTSVPRPPISQDAARFRGHDGAGSDAFHLCQDLSSYKGHGLVSAWELHLLDCLLSLRPAGSSLTLFQLHARSHGGEGLANEGSPHLLRWADFLLRWAL